MHDIIIIIIIIIITHAKVGVCVMEAGCSLLLLGCMIVDDRFRRYFLP